MNKLLLLISLITLLGCTPQARERWAEASEIQTYGVSARQACSDAGLVQGTPEYAQCFIDIKKAQLAQPKPVIINQQSTTRPTQHCTSMQMGGGMGTMDCM
jgi:hypothetical protein